MLKIKLFERKECTVLTWQGRLILLLVFLLIIISYFKFAPLFLSINKPVHGQVLILDGQMPDFAIKQAIRIFDSCHYNLIITTGGIIQSGYHLSGNKTMAEYSHAMFINYGFDPENIVAVPGGNFIRNRTFSSALSLKNWLINQHKDFYSFDILAIGCHARRSRYLFRKALGEDYKVGIISLKDPAYDPRLWWRSSIGARAVFSETIAYLYARLFFRE